MIRIVPPLEVLVKLLDDPTHMYITPGGQELYVSDGSDNILMFTGPDFNYMAPETINQFIVDEIQKTL